MKGGIEACYSSVSCACALLGALEELLQGRALHPEQVQVPPTCASLRFGSGLMECKVNCFPPGDRLSCCSDAGTT